MIQTCKLSIRRSPRFGRITALPVTQSHSASDAAPCLIDASHGRRQDAGFLKECVEDASAPRRVRYRGVLCVVLDIERIAEYTS